MAYSQKSNWGYFADPEYNRLQNQIHLQTQALLRERDGIQSHHGLNYFTQQPYLKSVQSQKIIKITTDRNLKQVSNPDLKTVLSQKVKQLIDLCQKENLALGNQLLKVLDQQKNIYSYVVNPNGGVSEKIQPLGLINPIIEAQKQSSVYQSSRQRSNEKGIQSPVKFVHQQKIRQAVAGNQRVMMGEQLIQMIEQIEKKALNQIQKLRQQKIDLMKQLKQQIQSNNQLHKQINAYAQQISTQKINHNSTPYKQFTLDQPQQNQNKQEQLLFKIVTEMDNLKKQNCNLRAFVKNQPPLQQIIPNYSQSQIQSLSHKITILEGQLWSRNQLIKELSQEISRLNQQGGSSSHSQLSHLIQQGELIRQQTLHLIRLKQGHTNSKEYDKFSSYESERIRELQQLLEREEQEKHNFLNDLLAFKQNYQQLEEENRMLKRQFKLQNSDLNKISPIVQKSNHTIENYERILPEMKPFSKY